MMAVLRGRVQFYASKGGQRDPGFRVKTGAGERLRPYQRLRVAHDQGKGSMAIKFVHQY